MDRTDLAGMIDQTLLKPSAGYNAARDWMEAQRDAGFATLCVSPFLVPLADRILAESTEGGTVVCSVCGFPLGYMETASKAAEAARLVELGCAEVDMVVNIAALLEGSDSYVRDDIKAVVNAVYEYSGGAGLVKVILETGYLERAQIVTGSRLAVEAGAHFVKTSTGFGPRGASIEDVRLMRETVGSGVGVKAAGGIRDLSTALGMLAAGANRIGTSSGIELLNALDAQAG